MNKNYTISLSILLILQTLNFTASPQQPTEEEQRKAMEGLAKIIDDRIDKKLKSMPGSSNKGSQFSDQEKQMIAGLYRAPKQQLIFRPTEEPAANILRSILQLDDELKTEKTHKMSLEHFFIQSLNNNSIEYQAQSKAASHGWLDLRANLSLLWNGKYANQNKFDISIKQSIEFPGSFEFIIHAQGTCDTANKDLQAAHNNLAACIKNSPNFKKYANLAAIRSAEQAERETRLQGESSGVCYEYGCQKNIRIICSHEILMTMLQEKNSSKYKFNTMQDEPFIEKAQPTFNFGTSDFLKTMQAKIKPVPQQSTTEENAQEDKDDDNDDENLVDSEETNDTEDNAMNDTSTENK